MARTRGTALVVIMFVLSAFVLPALAQQGGQEPAQLCQRCNEAGCAKLDKHSFATSVLAIDTSMTCTAGRCLPDSIDNAEDFCATLRSTTQATVHKKPPTSRKLIVEDLKLQQLARVAHAKPHGQQAPSAEEQKFSSYFRKRALREDSEGLLPYAGVRRAPRYLRVAASYAHELEQA